MVARLHALGGAVVLVDEEDWAPVAALEIVKWVEPVSPQFATLNDGARAAMQWLRKALAEYREAISASERIHATCEDYRAAASIDLDHDAADAAGLAKAEALGLPTVMIPHKGRPKSDFEAALHEALNP